MAKPEKVSAVAEITEQFKNSTAAVITEYRGLSVGSLTQLRRALGEGATYSVAKNTLVKRAAAEAGVEGLDDLFVGPTAIAFIAGEPVDAAKALKAFAKDNKALVVKGGYMDGAVLSVDEVNKIADLESREVLLAKLAGAMKATWQRPQACSTLLLRRWLAWRPPCRRRRPKRPPEADPHHRESLTHPRAPRRAPSHGRGSATRDLQEGPPSWRSSPPKSCSTRSRN